MGVKGYDRSLEVIILVNGPDGSLDSRGFSSKTLGGLRANLYSYFSDVDNLHSYECCHFITPSIEGDLVLNTLLVDALDPITHRVSKSIHEELSLDCIRRRCEYGDNHTGVYVGYKDYIDFFSRRKRLDRGI